MLADELIATHADAVTLALVITAVASGSSSAEQLAAELAVQHFEIGASSANPLSQLPSPLDITQRLGSHAGSLILLSARLFQMSTTRSD